MKTQKEGYDSEGKKTQNCALLRIAVLLLEISGLNLSLGAFILQGNRYFVISVSYTHLDVYKRQEELVGRYSLHSICTYLDLPRGTYYNYIKNKNKVKVEDLEDEFFKPLIRQAFEKSGERMTAAQIRHRLRRDGHEIGCKRVKRMMKEMKLIPYSQRQIRFDYTPSAYGKRNKLRRQFYQTDPNKVWASDFTYICINGIKYYLCVVLDLFSRKVLAYNLSLIHI